MAFGTALEEACCDVLYDGKLTGDLARIVSPDTDVTVLTTEELINTIAEKLREKMLEYDQIRDL